MKKILFTITMLVATTFLLAACSDDDQAGKSDASEKVSPQAEKNDDQVEDNEDTSDSEETKSDDSGKTSSNKDDSNNPSDGEDRDSLSGYSSDEIEFARVWLQLGDTQDIDELNAEQLSSGEPLNPDDETSMDYPEDVVQLTGSRLAEGSITYSSNGDGTIKVYNKTPARWDGKNPAGEDTYKEILEDTEQVSIDPSDDEKVEELIKKLHIDS